MPINSPFSIANLLKPPKKPSEEIESPAVSIKPKALNLAEKLAGKLIIYVFTKLEYGYPLSLQYL